MAPSKSHLRFLDFGTSESGRTRVVRVLNQMAGTSLGMIRWRAPWRRYVFESNPGIVYDHECLLDIAHELRRMTQTHKSR